MIEQGGQYDVARFSRARKDWLRTRQEYRELGLPVRGTRTAGTQDALTQARAFIESMRANGADAWFVDKVHTPGLSFINPDLYDKKSINFFTNYLEQAYYEGILFSISYRMRLENAKRKQQDNPPRHPPVIPVEDVVVSYTTNFLSFLHVCDRYRLPPKTALELAAHSYAIDSREFVGYIQAYPTAPHDVVAYAALRKPDNPDAFLSWYSQTYERVSKTSNYLEIPPNDIHYAVFHHRNGDPEHFLNWYQSMFATLRSHTRYRDLPEETLRGALREHSGNLEAYLEQQVKKSTSEQPLYQKPQT